MSTDKNPLLGSGSPKLVPHVPYRFCLSHSRTCSSRRLFAVYVVFGCVIGLLMLHSASLRSSTTTSYTTDHVYSSENRQRRNDQVGSLAAVQLELKHPADKNEKPKVLCVVQVDHQPELVVVASESWLKFCNTPLLYGTKSESSRDLIAKSSSTDTVSMEIIPNTASRAGYKRLITVLKYVKKIMSPRARNSSENTSPQWLLLTEVCTFVVMSNLQRLLSTMTPDRPHYLGHALSSLGDQDPVPWNQLLAGVVLSRGAVEVLLKAVDEKKFADLGSDTNYHEDALLGRMLGQLDVHPVDTRDSQGYPRFLSLSVQQLFDPLEQAKSKFFWKSSWFHLDQVLLTLHLWYL